MSGLPDGWSHFSLKDLGGLSGGKTPSKANPEFWSNPDVPWVSPKDMKRDLLVDAEDRISESAVENVGMTLYPAGSVLMVTRSGILQHTFPVALAGAELTVNQDIKVLRPVEGINPQFGFYLLKSFGGEILSACSKDGTTVQSIDSEKLEAFAFPLPPLAEQTRIAAKLDELLAQVDTLKARIDSIPALLKRFRQSVLAAAVSGRLTEEWRLKDPLPLMTGIQLMAETADRKRAWSEDNESHNEVGRVRKRLSEFAAKHMSQNDLPSSWCWAELEDVSLLVVDCHNKTAPYEKDGIPLVRTSNIRDGSFLWADLRYVNEETYRFWSRRCIPEPGDIVFTREAPMGEATIIPAGKMICLGQRTMLIRCIPECTSAEFVLLALRDPKFKVNHPGFRGGLNS